jgi:hypothetical protein
MVTELALLISQFIAANPAAALSAACTLLAAIASAVWWLASNHYKQQISVLQLENSFQVKQLADKDSYARGVIEVLNQRMLMANEEPATLRLRLQEKESQLAALQNENTRLLKLTANRRTPIDVNRLLLSISGENFRSALRGIVSTSHRFAPRGGITWDLQESVLAHEKSAGELDKDYLLRHFVVLHAIQSEYLLSADVNLTTAVDRLAEVQRDSSRRLLSILRPMLADGQVPHNSEVGAEEFEVESVMLLLEYRPGGSENAKDDAESDDDVEATQPKGHESGPAR